MTSSANAVSENARRVRKSATAFMPNGTSEYRLLSIKTTVDQSQCCNDAAKAGGSTCPTACFGIDY